MLGTPSVDDLSRYARPLLFKLRRGLWGERCEIRVASDHVRSALSPQDMTMMGDIEFARAMMV